jgi:peptide/nickel transport system permease protein
MSDNLKNEELNEYVSASTALDDEQRVKVLSPGMLVAKRFIRNKLAMIGLVILIFMFLFSFVGGQISPYGEAEVFRTTEVVLKDYAGATYSDEYLYTEQEGLKLPSAAISQFILAVNKKQDTFEAKEIQYSLIEEGQDFYRISGVSEIGTALTLRGISSYTETLAGGLTDTIKAGYEAAVKDGLSEFEVDGIVYLITKIGKENSIGTIQDIALATKRIFNTYADNTTLTYQFKFATLKAIEEDIKNFEVNGITYTITEGENDTATISTVDGMNFASVSKLVVRPMSNDVFLSVDFKTLVENAIINGEKSIVYVDENGEVNEYTITNKDKQYTIRRLQETVVNALYSEPSKEHFLGTDGNGMDILTRLMYGGRISLLIGFIAIGIEIFIGVILGGLAGYFGKWIDTAIMRLVDVFNCIPSMPLYIILGAVMDYYRLAPQTRIYLLCVILGLLSWPGIARMVRGQILSLREQEFMTAAEATGISVYRRIFKHLVPNVIPQLIVVATMGLGDIILVEATLSFLGLGVKYPFASWGNIINAVNDVYVMTNYLFVWIPAGMLILLTVLGFNFVGDGLRDAFDPKMKR